jgi:hypothetical protein
MKTIPVDKWGKDHWTLLSYMETLCVDSSKKGVGEIDKRRMRTNEKRHPLHAVNLNQGVGSWQADFGTRLAGYWDSLGRKVPKKQVRGHDDWDCLDDLEKIGFIEVISEANGFVKLTKKGMKVSGELRAYKAQGGMFSGFRWAEPKVVEQKA